jgi:hypothetical protein
VRLTACTEPSRLPSGRPCRGRALGVSPVVGRSARVSMAGRLTGLGPTPLNCNGETLHERGHDGPGVAVGDDARSTRGARSRVTLFRRGGGANSGHELTACPNGALSKIKICSRQRRDLVQPPMFGYRWIAYSPGYPAPSPGNSCRPGAWRGRLRPRSLSRRPSRGWGHRVRGVVEQHRATRDERDQRQGQVLGAGLQQLRVRSGIYRNRYMPAAERRPYCGWVPSLAGPAG